MKTQHPTLTTLTLGRRAQMLATEAETVVAALLATVVKMARTAKLATAEHHKTAKSAAGVSRGAAVRAQKRSQMDAQRIANQFMPAPTDEKRRANFIDDSPRLKIIGLGGMDGGGSKNMILIEYINDAVVVDCGNDLGVDLPGINYGNCRHGLPGKH